MINHDASRRHWGAAVRHRCHRTGSGRRRVAHRGWGRGHERRQHLSGLGVQVTDKAEDLLGWSDVLLLAVEYFLERRTGFSLALNALLLAVQSLGGSPEASFLLFFCWGLYLLYRIRHVTDLFSFKWVKLAAFGFLAGLLGFLAASFQLWPFFEYLFHSYGLELRLQEWPSFLNGGPERLFSPFGFFLGLLFPVLGGAAIVLLQRKNTLFVGFWSGVLGGLCLIVALRIGFWLGAKPHLLMQVLPELYGKAVGGCRSSGEISFSALNGGYAGVIPAFLALYTFVAPCKRRPLPFYVFLFVLSFGAAHSIPWLVHLVKAMPYLGWIHNSCLLSLTAFSILSQYLEKLFQLASVIASPTAPESLRNLAYSMGETAERLMKKVLEGFELQDISSFLPQLDEVLANGPGEAQAALQQQGILAAAGGAPGGAQGAPQRGAPTGGGLPQGPGGQGSP